MKTLKKFEFASAARSKYDWNKLLDGGIYQLTKDDFSGKSTTMSTLIRNQAKRQGVGVKVSVQDDDSIVMQASEPATDETRAAAKEARDEAKAAAREAEGEGDE